MVVGTWALSSPVIDSGEDGGVRVWIDWPVLATSFNGYRSSVGSGSFLRGNRLTLSWSLWTAGGKLRLVGNITVDRFWKLLASANDTMLDELELELREALSETTEDRHRCKTFLGICLRLGLDLEAVPDVQAVETQPVVRVGVVAERVQGRLLSQAGMDVPLERQDVVHTRTLEVVVVVVVSRRHSRSLAG